MLARAALALACLLFLAAPAHGWETAYLYDSNSASLRVVALDGVGTQFGDARPINGLGNGDAIAAIDVRPSTGELYALTVNTGTNPDHAELYRLTVGAGGVTARSVGVPGFVPSGSLGAAFHPRTDHLQVVGSNGLNVRLNADSATVLGADPAPAFAPGDPNEGEPASVSGIGYAGETLLAIAGADEFLGSLNATGRVTTIGATGVPRGAGQDSVDVSPATGMVWWLRSGFSRADVWRVDPHTGAAVAGIPFDVPATAMALLPASTISLDQGRAGGFSEGDGSALVLVSRYGPATGTATVPYEVDPGTSDVAAASGTVSFADGERQKQLRIPLPQDTLVEGTEFFRVELGEPAGSDAAGAVLGNPTINVPVHDDDVAPVAPPKPAADTAGPTLRISAVPRRKLTRKQLLRGFTVRVLASEPVSLDVSLRANPRRGVFASAFELALFDRHYPRSPFTRRVKVRPSKRLVGRITRTTRLRLAVVAMDAAGNRTTLHRTVRVRR